MTKEEISFFDKLSENWDDNEVLSTPEKINEILSRLDIREGAYILDLGTGTGVLIPYLSTLAGEMGHVVAIDASEGMLKKAIGKNRHLNNVTFRKSDFECETPEGTYDLIMLYCVYPHLKSPRETISRLVNENLKPGGKIIIAFPTDEAFINNIHKERKAESDRLPSAHDLCALFVKWGLKSTVVGYDSDIYIVSVGKS